MNYQNFCKQLIQSLEEKLGKKYQVKITDIEKNNGVVLEGIIIIKEESQISPNIYLEYFYDRYREGESLEEITEEILIIYHETLNRSTIQIDQLAELKKHEDNIFFRLINYKMNKTFLKKVPHIHYLEFAITFHCLVEKQEYGIQSFCINETIRQEWGICVEKLYQLALKNTPLLFPPKIQSMETMMYQIMEKSKENLSSIGNWFSKEKNDYKEQYEKSLENMLLDIDDSDETFMYVLSNGLGIYGATALLYPNVLDYFACKSGKNLYLLPSSIHEWIIVIEQEEYSEEFLKSMVYDVNHTQVPDEEVLSNQIYFYNKDTKRMEAK